MWKYLAGAASALLALNANSAIVSFNYVAVGTSGDVAGATVTGTFGYDTSVPDEFPGDPDIGSYPGSGFFTGTVSGGAQDGYSFNLPGLRFFVRNDPGDDRLTIEDIGTFVQLIDNDGTVFSSDALPLSLSLAEFEQRDLAVAIPGGIQRFYTLTAIPLPGAVWLLASALGMMGWLRFKSA